MTLYAHLDPVDGNGMRPVREIITVPDGLNLGQDFGSTELAADCVSCSASVSPGMLYNPGTKRFSAAPGPDIEALIDLVLTAGAGSCSAITQQVVPDDTHRLAYQNAAVLVFASGGAAPTIEPAKSVFAAQAQSQGLTADAFAAVVQGVTVVSLQLATILSTLRTAALAAKTPAALASALTAFEAALNQIVTTLNGAGLTISVTPPPPITINGVSAT